jgi:hypothetical protein
MEGFCQNAEVNQAEEMTMRKKKHHFLAEAREQG